LPCLNVWSVRPSSTCNKPEQLNVFSWYFVLKIFTKICRYISVLNKNSGQFVWKHTCVSAHISSVTVWRWKICRTEVVEKYEVLYAQNKFSAYLRRFGIIKKKGTKEPWYREAIRTYCGKKFLRKMRKFSLKLTCFLMSTTTRWPHEIYIDLSSRLWYKNWLTKLGIKIASYVHNRFCMSKKTASMTTIRNFYFGYLSWEPV
jgi:hypothetical protein